MRISSRLVTTPVALAGALVALTIWAPTALATGPAAAATRVGSAPAHQRLTVVLPLKIDQRGLAAMAMAVSTPGSPQYGHYQSLSAVARRFGAPAAARAHVISYLRRAGATHVAADRAGLSVSATVSIARAQRLFGTRLSAFRTAARAGAARFVAPETASHVPAPLSADVTGVVGLDTQPLAQTPPPAPTSLHDGDRTSGRALGTAARVDLGSAYEPQGGTRSGCAAGRPAEGGFTPNEYNDAYGMSALHRAGFAGRGERVALVEIDGYKPSDIRRFTSCYGLGMPHIKAFRVGIKRLLAPGGETTLDLEVLTAAAPKLSGINVYESGAAPSAVLRSVAAAIESRTRRPDVVSASLGGCEPSNLRALGSKGINLYEHQFEAAAATGVSVIAAAGDDGSTTCVNIKGKPIARTAVSFPASSPFVTAVGGTNVHLNASNQIIASRTVVWNDGPGQAAAGGGGASALFSQPSYQSAAQTSGRRELPDVSMLADLAPGYEIYCSAKSQPCDPRHGWLFIGGTSAGTPLLAGGVALADQALRKSGRSGIGFANPLLYTIAQSPSAPAVFADVTAGSNDLFATKGQPLGCCTAAAGYDDASGIGQVNLAGLTAVARSIEPRLASVSARAASPQRAASHRLVAKVSCSAACVSGATATLRIAGGSSARLTAWPQPLAAGQWRTVKLGIGGKLSDTISRALRSHHKVAATIVGTVLDGAGKTERKSAPVRVALKR
ncbi:MAG TPA: S53 family serine peptidase [Solirubrobacteraceae bacterium]|nr:S53 family serine peptidase [Solirubrobacteraceae bacterium]